MMLTITETALAQAFNTWMDRYLADPDGFEREWQSVVSHQTERQAGQEPSYGQAATAYLAGLLQDGEPSSS